MKYFKFSHLNVLFNFAVGAFIAFLLGFNYILGGVIANAIVLIPSALTWLTGKTFTPRFALMAGLLKEIWISRLMEKFYPTAAWLERAQDFSALVEYNTINLAEIGADPNVLVNNTTYPVPFADRADVPLTLPLDYYDTEGTVVRNAEAIQLAYPKMDTVLTQHGKALAKKQSAKAAWNYTPASDTVNTPVLSTDIGFTAAEIAAFGAGERIPFSFNAIIALGQKYDELDLPQEGRVLVLDTLHKADLMKEDLKLYKSLTDQGKGIVMKYGTFDIYVSTQTATFNATTKVKKAFGAAAAGTDGRSSFAFMESEVMRARGTMDMFSRLKDPEARGDIVGFQQRFIALSIRGKYNAAIVDKFAA